MGFEPEKMKKIVSVEVGGRQMTFETGWLAKQAAGSVLVRCDNSAVLVTCQDADPRPGTNFFPLTVEYREKTGAAGKIPGGFFKREGRPTQKEILTCRLIDRPLRPMFEEGFMQETQIIASVYSADQAHDPDVCGMNGASMAAILAGLPFHGPVASVRVGLVDDEFIINPTYDEREASDLELVMAGTMDAISMVEAGANELSEDDMIQALEFGHESIKAICKAQLELKELVNPTPSGWVAPAKPDQSIIDAAQEFAADFRKAVQVKVKHERKEAISEVKAAALEKLLKEGDDDETALHNKHVKEVVGGMAYQAIRDITIEENHRLDGRAMDEIRDIHVEVAPFPRTHGSSIFTRGETQALVNVTLGTAQDTQRIDGLTETKEEAFMLHYNFPPFCVGEARFLRGPSRREIGHGALAERALRPMLPSEADFPYTLRVVSDVFESNGSSSMATVCGGSMSMMDAGVPLKRPVAGIAMGMIKEGDEVRVLSDILGDEDHCGDMDFKVCGTEEGITALQMDIKVKGLSREIMEQALNQARDGRIHILGEMAKGIEGSRAEISPYAPRYEVCQVPVDKIGMVIGPGGKMIRALQEETGSTISIEDDGTVKIFAEEGAGAMAAKEKIVLMTEEIEVGTVLEATISSIKDFGVFAEFVGRAGREGMCHVSELSDEYVSDPNDAVNMGDVMAFKVINVEQGTGKIKLSRKAVILEERGEEYTPPAPRAPRGRDGGRGRGGRDGGRGRGGDRGPRRPRNDD